MAKSDRTWQTHDAEPLGGKAAPSTTLRLVRILSYDDPSCGGQVIALENVTRVHLGGGPSAVSRDGTELHVRTPDHFMSQSHACIELDGDLPRLSDLGSRNGTSIEGRRALDEALVEGAWFETGHTAWMLRRAPRESSEEVVVGPTKSYSPLMASLLERVARLAGSPVPLVLAGPTGSGKEVIAQQVHALSKRSGDFVGVNCGAIVSTLLESELFGHLRGAFTGATSDRRGYVQTAHGGTLFLDEVSELPLAAQVRLLRVLELGEVVPVGAVMPIRVDLRVLSASNRDLEDLVDEGGFRADLYARLAGYVLLVPPLAKRKEDLGELIAHFVRVAGRAKSVSFDAAAARALLADDWPLNVRGLRRAIESALALAPDRPIGLDDLPVRVATSSSRIVVPASEIELPIAPLSEADEQLRTELIAALKAEDGNVTRAAARLGKHRQQFQRWMRRLRIPRVDGDDA